MNETSPYWSMAVLFMGMALGSWFYSVFYYWSGQPEAALANAVGAVFFSAFACFFIWPSRK